MKKLPEINKVNVKNKKVLVRVDFNVPVSGNKVTDNSRIMAAKTTIDYLVGHGAVVGLVSHMGEPEGKKNKKFSLRKVVKEANKVLGVKLKFVPDCIGKQKEAALQKAKPGDVLLFENTRFYNGEKENTPDFSEKLAEGFDIFVNDAFSASHRAHASTVGVAKMLPHYAGAGLLLELRGIALLEKPSTPFMAIIGGAKISSKIDVLKQLIDKVDVLAIGGAMANTFFVSEGYDVGKSLYEENFVDTAEEISRLAHDNAIELLLPDDVVVAKKMGDRAKTKVKAIDEVAKDEIIVDIGPKSVAKFAEPIKFAGTIFWNGPVGVAEYKPSRGGTEAVAKIISESKAVSVIGGGDTLAAVKEEFLKFDFVSTGGGATLEYVAGHKLPGVEALR